MARTLNPVAHAVRRDAFIDVAQRLVQVRGFEQLSIQDVIDEVGVSKGAFYHYFDSKAALLDAVVGRMIDDSTATLEPGLADPSLSAIAKLGVFFGGIASWKAGEKDLVIAIGQVWLSDDNAIVRDKFRRRLVVRLTPMLAAIIRQGRDEGVFTASDPDVAARVLVAFIGGLNEAAMELFLDHQAGAVTLEDVERRLRAYAEAFERILGAPEGSFPTMDRATLESWFD
jgi:AcrR family transcriptional regulator